MEKKLWNPETKRLRRSYCRGPSDVEGFDSDYAFLIAGLLDLFAANGATKWLNWAYELQQSMDNLFWDDNLGVYRSTYQPELSDACCKPKRNLFQLLRLAVLQDARMSAICLYIVMLHTSLAKFTFRLKMTRKGEKGQSMFCQCLIC